MCKVVFDNTCMLLRLQLYLIGIVCDIRSLMPTSYSTQTVITR